MEESSEAPMDTDVSSTTEDVMEVQEVTESHHKVETVIKVEEIKEEDMSPNKDKSSSRASQMEVKKADNGPAKIVERSPPKEPPVIKKIIIKSPFKDLTIKAIKKNATNPEESQSTSKDANKLTQPSKSQQPEDIVDSSSKIDSQKSVFKDVDLPNEKCLIKEADSEKISQKLPRKDSSLAESTLVSTKLFLTKSNTGKDYKVITIKESVPKASPAKEPVAKLTPLKETAAKLIPTKEPVLKIISMKEPAKLTPAKEQTAKPAPSKPTPTKDTPAVEKPETSTSNTQEELITKSNENISILDVDKEASNDSQMETNSDTSEKDHNKSISRELRSLINSAKESKIISECTQLTSKTRKSRTLLDSSNPSLSTSLDPDKIHGVRRNSDNSQKSGCSEISDKTALKRSMRSQNPEFVSKVKHFLNTITGKLSKDGPEVSDEEMPELIMEEDENEPTPKKKKAPEEENLSPAKYSKLRTDTYCWRCHYVVEPTVQEKGHPPMQCTVCPRAFHFKCLTSSERSKIVTDKHWVCPECLLVLHAESSETRSPAMKKISLGMLCELLKYALTRMMDLNGVEPFIHPVNRTAFPVYDKYVVHPMDLTLMKENIAEGLYGSTEAFLADAQWILHNSIIFNTFQSKLTSGARALVRSCRAEMGEIEACPECYAAANNGRRTWFTDVCSTPHILLWAKLKGFPYWPAKGMSVNSSGLVDVRFFGAHDRAWVPAKDCFLYCERDPNNFRTKRQDILDSMQEAEQHIRNITRKYGKFVYPPFKTHFDGSKLNEQLKLMIPAFEGEDRTPAKDKPVSSPCMVKEKSRSVSKTRSDSKSSFNEGETSEGEDTSATRPRKMADGAEIAMEEDDVSVDKEKDKTIEIEVPQAKETDRSRKRRRSELEEAVITILDTGSKEKKRRLESEEKTEIKNIDAKKESKESTDKEKETVKDKVEETAKPKDLEPSSSEKKPTNKVRLISIAKVMQNDKTKEIVLKQQKQKPEKSNSTEKDKGTPEDKKSKRRNTKTDRSLNNSTVQMDKGPEKKNEKTKDPKEKVKENSSKNTTEKTVSRKNSLDKVTQSSSNANSPKSIKDRIHFDDDTTLAVIAREVAKSTSTPNLTGLPTITSVRSLSTAHTDAAKTNTRSIEITVPAPTTDSTSIFTPTSTDSVRNMKEAVNKLQKLRSDTDPPIGRVGVRAFARMKSAEKETPSDVQVEIKAEPMELEDADRQMEKLDLMNAFKLRPVNPNPSPSLRDVRINKVVTTPVVKTPVPKPPVRPRAKKTFPQPKKPDDGRSELNGKNSMVYIPIQPPMTQAPARLHRSANGSNAPPTSKIGPPTVASTANSVVNTVITPMVPSLSSLSSPTPTSSSSTTVLAVPTVGQVPTTVHTVPLITSVNGQWTFSLQPVMSVGGVDGAASPPMMNGLPERPMAPLVPIGGAVTTPTSSAATSSVISATPIVTPNSTQTPKKNSNDNALREPPRLQQRPGLMNPLDAGTPVGSVPPPSTAGPLTAKLNQNAVKMTDFFRTLLEDSLEKLDEPITQLTTLKLQLEQVHWRHQQEIAEIKHNHELTQAEIRSSFEKEKSRLISETRRSAQVELEAAVKLAKSKQWCANCSQEAQFYCCWNTSYCDYPCQRAHWALHYAVCTQQRPQDNIYSENAPESRLQPAPEILPKTTAAPSLTVGGKLAPSRIYTQDGNPQKASMIVSMVEDPSGNQTIKCVGTYKPGPSSAQVSPLIINKQLLSNEESSKKVVTTGGYLIVGAAPNSGAGASTATLGRRTHTIQYYT